MCGPLTLEREFEKYENNKKRIENQEQTYIKIMKEIKSNNNSDTLITLIVQKNIIANGGSRKIFQIDLFCVKKKFSFIKVAPPFSLKINCNHHHKRGMARNSI